MTYINLPHPSVGRVDVFSIVLRVYKTFQDPPVLEAGGEAFRAIANAAKHVGKFVYALRSAWPTS